VRTVILCAIVFLCGCSLLSDGRQDMVPHFSHVGLIW